MRGSRITVNPIDDVSNMTANSATDFPIDFPIEDLLSLSDYKETIWTIELEDCSDDNTTISE